MLTIAAFAVLAAAGRSHDHRPRRTFGVDGHPRLAWIAFPWLGGVPRSALIIISDGESSDGAPTEVCRALARQGTTIISAYPTSSEVTEARHLYAVEPVRNHVGIRLGRCRRRNSEVAVIPPTIDIALDVSGSMRGNALDCTTMGGYALPVVNEVLTLLATSR